jgi:putative ABC transport system permease protein
MGASRGEIMAQFLTEALLLAAAGGFSGLVFGAVTLKLLLTQIMSGSEAPQYYMTSQIELPVLLFSLGLSLLTGLLFGFYPAWEAARASVGAILKDEAGQVSSTRGMARVRKVLVCAQVVVAAVLLIPTGLFLKSLVNLFRVDLGIRTENIVDFRLSPELNGYKPGQSRALFERVEAEVSAIPGVRSVAAALIPVIAGSHSGNSLEVEGYTPPDRREGPHAWVNEIGPGYFGKMGIPLVAGREFTESDSLAAPKIAVVNEEFARKFFQGRNPVGRHFGQWRSKLQIEIVGVVKDSHYGGVKEKPYPVYYSPWRQDKDIGDLEFYVRTALPPAQLIPQIRKTLAQFDRNLPAEHLRTLDQQIAMNISNDRILVQLAAAFAGLATVLAMLGLYGVMAHGVTRRTREIGIRMAVGASPALIRVMVLREMAWILGIGLLLGIPAALALARYTESQLYGVKAYDSLVVAAAALALGVTALAAAYLPAHRASRVSPVRALHYE